MRYCQRCVLPDTKPGVTFDTEGVCSACRWVERKRTLDWGARAARLRALTDGLRGSNGNGYECVVPVSGGKDSMYQVYTMSQVYGLRTLAVIVVPHLQTPEGIHNLNALVQNLGVDLLRISVRPSTLQKIRRLALLKIGNPNYAEHRVMFAAVARAAAFYSAPLVVWGEDIGLEFGGTVDQASAAEGSAEELIHNDLFRESGFEELLDGALPDNELFFYLHPDKEELRRKGIKSIYLGHYHPWDGRRNFELARGFGFRPRQAGPLSGNVIDYDNIDEKLCELHLWFKLLKLGFWRPTDECCYLIWNGYMSREEGVRLVREKQYEFPGEYLADFLEYHQLTEEEFWTCAERFRNPSLWHRVGGEWRLRQEIA